MILERNIFLLLVILIWTEEWMKTLQVQDFQKREKPGTAISLMEFWIWVLKIVKEKDFPCLCKLFDTVEGITPGSWTTCLLRRHYGAG